VPALAEVGVRRWKQGGVEVVQVALRLFAEQLGAMVLRGGHRHRNVLDEACCEVVCVELLL
jgi:hypothetical protein